MGFIFPGERTEPLQGITAMDDSHLSKPTKGNEKSPLRQHHRMALGEKVSGESNPYGAAKGNTTNRVANNSGKTY